MTITQRTPYPGRAAQIFFLFIALISTGTTWAKDKKPAKGKQPPAKAQAAKNDRKSRESAKAAKNSRDDKRGAKSARNDRGARNEKSARNDRGRDKSAREARVDKRRDKNSARELRAARKERDDEKRGGRQLSRRERAAEARRLAEQRRREIAEARRRAELARQAAIARQRAIEQAMRDDAMANIAKDDTTGEDLEVRRAAVAALGNNAGTVVVMDPKTGRVYTVVNQEWALRRGFKPCSTIKLMTGLAGLTEKVINPVQNEEVSDRRYSIGLTDALAYSNNGYFQNVGGRVGFDRLIVYARELGLGERTGINHANESPGRVPLFKSGYAVNHMCSHGDDFEVTPMQLANMASTIGNGGNLLVPHLPRTPQEDVQFKTIVRRKVNIPQESMVQLIPGMIGAVNYGSGKKAYDPMQTIAGKTGTCIDRDRQWIGLFTSYAPVQNPRLAVVVVTKGGAARGHFPAYVAGQIYKSLRHRFGPASGEQPYAAIPVPVRPKVDPKAAAALSDEDREDETAEAVGDGASDAVQGSQPAGNGVRSVIMTVPQTRQPATSAPPAGTQAPSPQEAQRPRRVHTDRP